MLRANTLEEVQKTKKPVVLYFIEEGITAVEASRNIHDEELATLAKDGEAMFLIVEHNPDRTPSMDTGSPIPISKLSNPNPGREYNITRYPSVLVCDWHGNMYQDYNRVPSNRDIKRQIERVSESMKQVEQRLTRNLDAAKAALEKDDSRSFIRSVLNNFRQGYVGLEAQQESIRLYRELLDKTRDEIARILDDRPDDGVATLRSLSRDFRDTELNKEISDAMTTLRGR